MKRYRIVYMLNGSVVFTTKVIGLTNIILIKKMIGLSFFYVVFFFHFYTFDISMCFCMNAFPSFHSCGISNNTRVHSVIPNIEQT